MVGTYVFVQCKRDGNKHLAREIYIVTDTKPDYLVAQKLTQSQIRVKRYILKYDEVYVVPDSKPNTKYETGFIKDKRLAASMDSKTDKLTGIYHGK